MKRARERKPLLILDIAGVLIDGDAMTSRRKGIDEFFLMIFQSYNVVSWTSRNRYKERKGKKVPAGESRTRHAFDRYRHSLVAEFYGEHTTSTSLMNGWKPVCLKDVERVLEHPSVKELEITRSDVIVVDDSPVKWVLYDDVACLHPPTWSKVDIDDGELAPGGRIYEALCLDEKDSNGEEEGGKKENKDSGDKENNFWKDASADEVIEALGGKEMIRSSVHART